MRSNMLVSIVIPIYSVADYLPICIESVLKQTYSEKEIILVDDGSPDLSPKYVMSMLPCILILKWYIKRMVVHLMLGM